MKANFHCYYERDEKGIFMEVDTESYTSLVSFTFLADFKVQGEVCLEKEDVEKLIEILQDKLKK
jgi:hypothetical protein